MEIPDDRYYSEQHLWVKLEDGLATIGVTEHAREEMGDIDYIELPADGDVITRGQPFGIIETSKAVTDLIAPISGRIAEINGALLESPEALTDAPYSDGWLVAVEPADLDELKELMNARAYRESIEAGEDSG
ncbi:MAG: glycine cleavage system protein GcvH [Desulfomonilaceae bacterium]